MVYCRHREIAEQRYLGLYQFIDLSKDFFFSYTYDVTRTLQHNMSAAAPAQHLGTNPKPKDMYVWNGYMTKSIDDALGWSSASMWHVTLVHGAFIQRKCSLFGKIVNLTLIARRSRYFAGTRYLKRGISDAGRVANDVELEQIVHEECPGIGALSSFVQVRGSIPIFWTQETSVTMPKPPIVLKRVDPTYAATRAHFADLMRRYAAPINVLDLTKQIERREREIIVSHEFRHALEHINQDIHSEQQDRGLRGMNTASGAAIGKKESSFLKFDEHKFSALDVIKIRYCALDFSCISKQRQLNVLDVLEQVAWWTLWQTCFFCSKPRVRTDQAVMGDFLPSCVFNDKSLEALKQNGILRTNCIDCLDRTNVAQFTVGAHALRGMLAATGIASRDSQAKLQIYRVLSIAGL